MNISLIIPIAIICIVLFCTAWLTFWLKKNREPDSSDGPSGSPPEIPSPFTDADGNVHDYGTSAEGDSWDNDDFQVQNERIFWSFQENYFVF